MKAEVFRTLIEPYHLRWIAKPLNAKTSDKFGIDIYNDFIGIELKSRHINYTKNFAVHAYQVDQFRKENPNRELYWCFLIYHTSIGIKEITNHNLESVIGFRKAWFIEWDWIRQFPISNPKTGPYVYVGLKDFPEKNYFKEIAYNGGYFLVPNDSILEKILVDK